MRRYLLLSLVCLTIPMAASAQAPDTIRVCTYNLLQFGGDDVDRAENFRAILSEISPSLLFVQEVVHGPPGGPYGHHLFLDSVARRLPTPLTGIWTPVTGEGLQVAFFYDSTKFSVGSRLSQKHPFAPRHHWIITFYLKDRPDTLIVAVGHFKAGDTPDDEKVRWNEAKDMIGWVDDAGSQNFIYAADFNVYSSEEDAYTVLMTGDSGEHGRLYDPIDRPGDWHNNPSFADVHTQSPRGRQFGGGVHGGMDDRFDQILISEALLDNVRPNTYTAFGNDGQHFNDSINAMPNTAVSVKIAQALHDASDHLPVFVDFVFGATSGVEEARHPDELDLTVTPSPALKEETR